MSVLEPRLSPRPWAEPAVFGIALVVFAFTAQGGPGWTVTSQHAVLASQLERTAVAPLYDLLAGVFARLPLGEPGFRLGLLGAILGAATLAGLVATARALVANPLAGVIAAVILGLTPPFREATATATPGLLATAGLVWMIALATAHARDRAVRGGLAALVAGGVIIGSAPWLGSAVLAVLVVWLARAGMSRRLLAATLAGLGGAIVVLWIGAIGSLPTAKPSLASVVVASGQGPAALVVGAGLLGVAFGALTGLAAARWIVAIVALVATNAIIFDHDAVALVACLAVGLVIALGAIVRVVPAASLRPELIVLGAGGPLIALAVTLGPAITTDDPADAPARLASDLLDRLPSGPGIVVATRAASWAAIDHEQAIAGSCPDLALVPPLPAEQADAFVATALRTKRTAGADVAAFGRLDPRRAVPVGRGFALVSELIEVTIPLEPAAAYRSAVGADQAMRVELARAAYEAANSRLDAAARAIGLADRFGAADLAVLAATIPTTARPALYGYIPFDAGTEQRSLFGDDLAWVANIPQPELSPSAPVARKLHARWRSLLVAQSTRSAADPAFDPGADPAIIAMGSEAVAATRALWRVFDKKNRR